MSKYNNSVKGASAFTKTINAEFAKEFGIDLEDATNSEYELAKKGLILSLEDYILKGESGNTIIDLSSYNFLKEKAVADTVHPSLWLNGKSNLVAGVFEVLPQKIYQVRGLDIANITFVRSKTGWIVLDVTTSAESAYEAINLLETALEENVRDKIRAVIISHSHVDHFGGIKGVVSEEQVGSLADGKVAIFVPEGFDDETIKENVYAGTAMFHRSGYQFGGPIPIGKKGRVSNGLGIGMSNGTITYIRPTDRIKEDVTLEIDGLTVDFQVTPGTEAPAEMNNYFPEYKAFWAAENCTGTLHNLYPIRGAQVRNAANWWYFTNVALEKYGPKTEVVFQSHNWPHSNTKEAPNAVKDYLRNIAAIYKFIHDETLLKANLGKTAAEIAQEIQIPEKLKKEWYIRPYYGSVEVNARAVYNKYLGFYNGNPVNLNPLTEKEEAELWIELAGTTDRALEIAHKYFEKGDYRKAAKIANSVVYYDPENLDARYLSADAFEQLGYQSESSIWRNAYLVGANELRNGVVDLRRGESAGRSDLIANMTTEMILDYIGVLADGNKLADKDIRFRLVINNHDKTVDNYVVHIYAGTVLYYKGASDEELTTITAPEGVLLGLIGQKLDEIKPYIQADDEKILEILQDAIVNVDVESQFSLVGLN